MESRSTIIQNDKTSEDAAQIALPLICNDVAIGALYVDVGQDFQRKDQSLLEAFSRQLARNLQRNELRNKELPHKTWWSSFSTYSLENRLEITNLVHGIIREQSFSAAASSYLKEAHAIAYLDGTLAYVNQRMKKLANLNSQDLNEMDLFKLLERFKTDVFNEPILAIRRVMQTGDSFECELNFAAEKTLSLQITLVKIPVNDQSIHETNVIKIPACFLITFRDVTAHKENEKLRSDLVHLMSHELRTPITSIQGFAEMLTYESEISEDSREYLKIIAEESNRAAKTLSNFLSVANLEQSDKQEVIKSPVKINRVVREVAEDYEKAAKCKRIRIVEQRSKYIPPIAADQGLITKAISHLVDNAIRYSPERSSVIISTILETDFLRVDVEDRGYGIPRSEQEKIWQKFYRVAHDGQDKQEETTGLGLSMVKEIIEQHNGEVSVQSEVGRGSRFSFKIPRL
ncbi:MAG: GAF domain-containing sensor histidine kinase [Acidobacteriota bacterium]|nr:GAF domain-containing sensor histidine kinase [Acidobacteriota bacterium]